MKIKVEKPLEVPMTYFHDGIMQTIDGKYEVTLSGSYEEIDQAKRWLVEQDFPYTIIDYNLQMISVFVCDLDQILMIKIIF